MDKMKQTLINLIIAIFIFAFITSLPLAGLWLMQLAMPEFKANSDFAFGIGISMVIGLIAFGAFFEYLQDNY
jgi:putative Mn2+ efflux pump MntP